MSLSRIRLSAALFILTAASAGAQAVEVKGTVFEAGTNHGITGAIVTLNEVGFRGEAVTLDTTTDASGNFRFQLDRPMNFGLSARKRGYTSGSMSVRANATNRGDLRITLERYPEIEGRIEDWESRKPIPDFPRLALELAQFHDALVPVTTSINPNMTTDAEGRFLASPGHAGMFAIRVSPVLWSTNRFLTKFSEEDASIVDRDYEESYWPGGGRLETALPVQAANGLRANAGTIQARKIPYYRAHVSLTAHECAGSGQMVARLSRRLSQSGYVRETESQVNCGQGFLVLGLLPGNYRIELIPVSGTPLDQQLWGSASFEVVDQNPRVSVPLERGSDLTGAVVPATFKLAEGAEVILLRPGGSTPPESRRGTLDSEGRFRIPAVPRGDWWIGLTRLPSPLFLSSARVRGVPAAIEPGRGFASFSWNGSGSVELVLDDQPASISGVVTVRDQPVKDAVINLVRWPPPAGGYGGQSIKIGVTDEQGRFRLGGLPPGDYRVWALATNGLLWLDKTSGELLERFSRNAESVSLQRGGSQEIQLRAAP